MNAFDYATPHTVAEAVALLSQHPGVASALAGGTDLITQLREGRRKSDLVVDLKRIPELNRLEYHPEAGLRIGAAVPCSALVESKVVRQRYPMLAYACSLIGSYQIQNRASLGGNLCNASPSADGVPPLVVLGAFTRIAGPHGERAVPVEEFCTGPGRNILDPGEILVELRVPSPRALSGAAYERFIPRGEMDIAVVGAASLLRLDAEGRVAQARIALAAVAPVPLRTTAAEALLEGLAPTPARFAEAAAAAAAACSPISDVRGSAAYRRHLVEVLVRRTLAAAHQQAQGEE